LIPSTGLAADEEQLARRGHLDRDLHRKLAEGVRLCIFEGGICGLDM
jgi:hypothetical protein